MTSVFKLHSERNNQLTIPMYRHKAPLQRKMNRTRTGDFVLVMG